MHYVADTAPGMLDEGITAATFGSIMTIFSGLVRFFIHFILFYFILLGVYQKDFT